MSSPHHKQSYGNQEIPDPGLDLHNFPPKYEIVHLCSHHIYQVQLDGDLKKEGTQQ